MRVEAGDGKYWQVFHVPTCKLLKMVLWVDDVTNEYCYYTSGPVVSNCWPTHTAKANKITINPWTLVILIDPVEDEGEEVFDHVPVKIEGQGALAM